MRIFQSRSHKEEAVQFYVAPPRAPRTGSKLALAVLVRNEAASIMEWLAFHKAAGIDQFILYDDGSTDDTIALAEQTVGAQALRVIPWCQRLQDAKLGRAIHNQGLAFAHCVANFHQDFRWIGFIDVDEFLFPTQANGLRDVLSSLGHVDNILLPWQMFGRQGFETTPDRVLPNYRQRFRDPYQTEVKGILNFKCIVNPAKVTKAYVHGFETNGDKTIWNSKGTAFEYGAHRSADFNANPALQLNHYYSKSNTQLEAKIQKGSIGDSTFTSHFKNESKRRNQLTKRVLEIERDTVEDRGILNFCERLDFDPQ